MTFQKSHGWEGWQAERGLFGNPLWVLKLWCYGKHSMSLPGCSNQLLPWKIRGDFITLCHSPIRGVSLQLVKCQEFSVFSSAALPLLFPLQSDSHLPVHPHTSRVLGQSFLPLHPTGCCPPSFAFRALNHSHVHCIGFLMRSNCYHCVNHSFCFSLPLHPVLWLLMYNIMLGNMNCLVAANRRQQWFSQPALPSDTFAKAEETISVGNVCVMKPVWLAQEIRMINKEAESIRVKPHSYCRRNIWERKPDRAPEMKTPRKCPLLPPVPEQPLHLPDSCHEDSLYCIPFPFFFLIFHCSFLVFLSHFLFPSLNLWIF